MLVLFATVGGGGYNPLGGVPVEFVLVTFVALAILGGIPLEYRDRRRVHFIHVSMITKLRASCPQVSLHRASSAGRICLFAGLRKLHGKKTALNTIAIGLKKRFGLWLISNKNQTVKPRNVNWVVVDVFLVSFWE